MGRVRGVSEEILQSHGSGGDQGCHQETPDDGSQDGPCGEASHRAHHAARQQRPCDSTDPATQPHNRIDRG